MDLQITTRRWHIRIARRKPAAAVPATPPSNAPAPMRVSSGFMLPRRAAKDVR